MSWIIRLSKLSDYPGLMAIENQIWHSGNTPSVTTYETVEDYQKHFAVGSQLVAEDKETKEIVGLLGFRTPTHLPAHQKTWEVDVGVHPNVQGKGGRNSLTRSYQALSSRKRHP